jgi:hypothetical protein
MNDIRVDLRCFPCFIRQVVLSLEAAGDGKQGWHDLMRDVLEIIQRADYDLSPAHTTTTLHRRVREFIGYDPYTRKKRVSNEKAMRLLPMMRRIVREDRDPLYRTAVIAIAGNSIDFGIFSDVDITEELERAREERPVIDEYERFSDILRKSPSVLYLLDNAGEIVFDRILIEELIARGKDVTAVVRGGPVLNDVTMEDAVYTGIDGLCMVIGNGSDGVGTPLGECSEEFLSAFRDAPLVISKGQANFETLYGSREGIVYLFRAKCDVVADLLGIGKGSMVLKVR